MPKTRAKIRLSVLISIVFLEKRNHIPIIAKIMNTDTKMYDVARSVVICSDTESVNGSKLVRNGFAALRYLNPGRLANPLIKTPILEIIIVPRTIEQFLICLDSSLNFLIISHMTTYMVEKIMSIPA